MLVIIKSSFLSRPRGRSWVTRIVERSTVVQEALAGLVWHGIVRVHYEKKDYTETLEAFAQFIQLKDLSARTMKCYLAHVRMAGEHFSTDPKYLTEKLLREYFLFLRVKKNYVASSMNQAKVSLICFYHEHLKHPRWAVFDEIQIRYVEKLPVVISKQEVQSLLSCAENQRDFTIFALIYGCGLRLNEAIHVEVKDINSDKGLLHVRIAKGGKNRYVPITSELIELLRDYWKIHRNPDLLFPTTGRRWRTFQRKNQVDEDVAKSQAMKMADTPVNKSTIQQAMKWILAASGIKQRVTTHTLRHCYATHLLESGVSIRVISAYLGHASLNQTMVYAHLTSVSEQHTKEVLREIHKSFLENNPFKRDC